MKTPIDAEVFSDPDLRFHMKKEGCTYFANEHFEWQRTTFLPPQPQEALVWCASIWESKMLRGCHMRRIHSNFLALEFVRKGSLYVRQDETAFLAEEGDFFLLRPGGDLEIMTGPPDFCVKDSMILSGSLLEDILKRTGLEEKNYLPKVNVKKFESLLHSFKAYSKEYHSGILAELEQRAYDLILLLKEPASPKKTPDDLVALLNFMESNLERPFSLEELARHYGCSVSHLTRLFHLHCRSTPYRVLVEMRMRRAVNLLLETELSVKEIAGMVGYENSLNFSTEFKKRNHISPRLFRKGMLSP